MDFSNSPPTQGGVLFPKSLYTLYNTNDTIIISILYETRNLVVWSACRATTIFSFQISTSRVNYRTVAKQMYWGGVNQTFYIFQLLKKSKTFQLLYKRKEKTEDA